MKVYTADQPHANLVSGPLGSFPLRAVAWSNEMKRIPVRDFMNREPATATPEMPVTRLVALLARNSLRGVPVVEDGGRVVGVVSETDLFLKERGVPFSMREKAPSLLGEFIDRGQVDHFERCKQVKVADVMTPSVVGVTEDTTLEDACMTMLRRRLSLLPVVDEDRLRGVIRRIDLLRIIYSED